MSRVTYLVVLALAGLIAANAASVALALDSRGPGEGMPGMPGRMGQGLASYEQEAVIAPTRASGYAKAVIEGYTPVSATGYLSYDSASQALEALFQLTMSGVGEPGVQLQALLGVAEAGSLSIRSDGPSMTGSSSGTFTLSLEYDDGENYTMVDASFDYSESLESVPGNYSRFALQVQGPVTVVLQAPSQGLDLSIAFDFYLDVTVETSVAGGYAAVDGTMVVDFNTGDPMADAGYAFMLATAIQQLATMLGLEENVTVTTDPAQGSVTVEFSLYVTPEMLQGGVPGVPGVPGMPGPGMPFNLTNVTMPVSIVGFNVSADISYSFNLDAELTVDSSGASLVAAGGLNATGIPREAVGYDSLEATVTVGGDMDANVTIVEVRVSAEGLPDPLPAFYAALKAALDAAEEAESLLVTFRGEEGVMFGFEGPEFEVVTFTEENATLMEDLKLYYNGTGFMVEDDSLVIEGSGSAAATLPSTVSSVTAVGVTGLELRLGSPAAIALVSELEVEFADAYGTIVVGLENATVAGSVRLQALDPAEASSLIPPGVQATVAGPGVVVEGVVSGGGYVEVPLVRTPENPALIRIAADGSYEIITDVTVKDGRLEAEVPGFSTLIPVDLAAGEQPPGGGTTTTETTETATPTETETTPTTGTEATETTTTTPPEATATTPPATVAPTTQPPTETATETATPTETETTPPGTTTQETTTPTTTPPAASPGTTPPAEAQPPAGEEEGGVPTALIGALIAVVALAGVAALLLRR